MVCDVYGQLKRRILLAEYRPGQSLHEQELAQEFGVSRTPIREAFIRLQAEGWVVMAKGRGVRVSEPSVRELKEACELRHQLDGFVGKLVPERVTPEELAGMKALLQRMRSETEAAELRALDLAFHEAMDRATHNELLRQTLEGLRQRMTRVWDLAVPAGQDRYFAGIADEFTALVKAIERKDGEECTRILRAHLARYIDQIIAIRG
ncbi:MAG: GntR family transcriptional regulator [Candidatus Bipolaricaulota bacterium]